MKVLIADKLSAVAVSELEALGCTVVMNPDLSAESLPEAIGDADALVVRSTKVTADTINAAKNLSLIIRAGAGVNTIDLETASAQGIHVANTPGKNTDAVAELAIGHLIAADRRIVAANRDMAAGNWKKKEYGNSKGLKGRTLGIIGLGAIGKAVAKRAIGLDMEVIGWSRSLTRDAAEKLGIGYCGSADEVADKADAISLHIASKPETAGMVNADFLAKMKNGAILVNCARGEVVDTAALKDAIKTKGIRAGLDVFENEPTGGVADFNDTELAELAACTPHIGASTDQAAEAVASEVVNIVNSFMITGTPANAVNIQDKSSATVNLVVRHYNRVGVLAAVLKEIRTAEINVEEMENMIFAGGKAASCTLKLDSEPQKETLDNIRANENVIAANIKVESQVFPKW
ncbi:MAG: NAD(P)-binding domain-containing protein [Phycisphaerae bacterium]|nr:NAD(P)-binding domain-containing protein [Phycisphaerae bacterium]